MINVIVALFIAFVGITNDQQASCYATWQQAQPIEQTYGVNLYVHEDCSVEVIG